MPKNLWIFANLLYTSIDAIFVICSHNHVFFCKIKQFTINKIFCQNVAEKKYFKQSLNFLTSNEFPTFPDRSAKIFAQIGKISVLFYKNVKTIIIVFAVCIAYIALIHTSKLGIGWAFGCKGRRS